MGLDLTPVAVAKPGHEAEWRRLVEAEFRGDKPSEPMVARFREISIPPYEPAGAPRVGYDKAADDWIVAVREARTPDQIDACLKEFHGYYALALVGPPGIPKYSNGGLYDGVDATSFRGAFFNSCTAVLGPKLRDRAWENMWPEEALAYGRDLVRAADEAERRQLRLPPSKPSFLARLGLTRKVEDLPFAEAVDVVRSAGQWYVFWAERGHPIRAWA